MVNMWHLVSCYYYLFKNIITYHWQKIDEKSIIMYVLSLGKLLKFNDDWTRKAVLNVTVW